jgi:hypothetical protein
MDSTERDAGMLLLLHPCAAPSPRWSSWLGHLFPDELDALAGRLEDARAEALASLARTQRGPVIVPLREGAGQ